jgi:hypothetical protein
VLQIIAEEAVIDALVIAVPDARKDPQEESDDLNLNVAAVASVALKTFIQRSHVLWNKLKPLLDSKPNGKIKFKGPGGEIEVELANVTEATLVAMANKVMSVGSRTPSQG